MRDRSYNPSLYSCFFLLAITLFGACNCPSHQNPTEHPLLVSSIQTKSNQLPDSLKLKFIDSAFATFKPGPQDRMRRFGLIFGFYQSQHNYYKASEYGDSMITTIAPIAKTNKLYREELAHAYFFKGDAQFALNNVDTAIELYDHAVAIHIKAHKIATSHLFDYNMRLANGFYQQGNYHLAIKYYKRTLLYPPYSSGPWLTFTYTQALKDNIGLCFSSLGKADSALYYFDQALTYIKQNERNFNTPDQKTFINVAKGLVYGNKGKSLLSLGRKAEAESFFNLDVALTRGTYEEESGVAAQEELSMIYLQRYETQRVLQLLDTIRPWAGKPGTQHHRLQYLKILAGVSAQMGDFRKAHLADEQLLTLKDSLAKQKSIHSQENLAQLIAYNEKTNRVAQLEKEKTNARLLLAAGGLILALSVLIALLLWRSYRKSKQSILQLNALNKQVHIKNVELARAFDTLEQSHKVNARLTQTVAHDLRTPLVAMRNFIQLKDNPKLSLDEKTNIAKLIHTNCNDALSLIDDMLNNNTSCDMLSLAPVELGGLINNCILQVRERYEGKLQHLEFSPLNTTVMGDAEKLRRVFDNLLTNAIKFTEVKGTIKVLMSVVNEDVIISIADNGIGIPENIQQKLFDISADIKRRGTANEQSYGLGLFICRQIIEAHKGQIWFNSGTGGGAVFNVQLSTYRL